MKTFISILLFTFFFTKAEAQFRINHSLYLSGELTLGNYIGISSGLNYIYKNKYSASFVVSGAVRRARSIPNDYSRGISILFGPHENIENYTLQVGKIHCLNKSETMRVNFQVGLSYTILKELTNWDHVGQSWNSSNYTWQTKNTPTVSLVINPRFEFPFTPVYGLTIVPLIVLNPKQNYFGIGLGSMIGVLRKSRAQLARLKGEQNR